MPLKKPTDPPEGLSDRMAFDDDEEIVIIEEESNDTVLFASTQATSGSTPTAAASVSTISASVLTRAAPRVHARSPAAINAISSPAKPAPKPRQKAAPKRTAASDALPSMTVPAASEAEETAYVQAVGNAPKRRRKSTIKTAPDTGTTTAQTTMSSPIAVTEQAGDEPIKNGAEVAPSSVSKRKRKPANMKPAAAMGKPYTWEADTFIPPLPSPPLSPHLRGEILAEIGGEQGLVIDGRRVALLQAAPLGRVGGSVSDCCCVVSNEDEGLIPVDRAPRYDIATGSTAAAK